MSVQSESFETENENEEEQKEAAVNMQKTKTNLVEFMKQTKELSAALPMMMQIKKEVDYLFSQLGSIRENQHLYVKQAELNTVAGQHKKEMILYAEEADMRLRREIEESINKRMQKVDNMPNFRKFVLNEEFKFVQLELSSLKENLDHLGTNILEGYQADISHKLSSKVMKTEVEDMIQDKFDAARGKQLESKVNLNKEGLSFLEAQMEKLEKSIQKFDKKLEDQKASFEQFKQTSIQNINEAINNEIQQSLQQQEETRNLTQQSLLEKEESLRQAQLALEEEQRKATEPPPVVEMEPYQS